MQVMSAQTGGMPAQGVGRHHHQPTKEEWTQRLSTPEGEKFLQVVSDKTGISKDDLKSQLEGGADLGQILKSKGVSRSDFRQALEAAGIGPGNRAGGPPPGPPPGGGDDKVESAILSALSDKLGISEDDLTSKLESGTSLQSLAEQKGVSQEDLANVIEQALQNAFSSGTYGTDGSSSASSAAAVSGSQVNQLV